MNILVTGGAGYIGSHTVKMLMGAGHRVIVIDSLENGHRDVVVSPHFYQGDIRNRNNLEEIFKKEAIDIVMHFAAYASVPDSVRNPSRYYNNNVLGSLVLLDVMKKYDCKKIIFSSSAAVYGDSETEIISENYQKNPTNPYGHTKLIVEDILKWYNIAYGLQSISFRYFCAAGANCDAFLGERHIPETHIIPLALIAAIDNKDFTIFGNTYRTPDGTCIRDFVHVEDIASAHIMGAEYLMSQTDFCDSFNIGTGRGYSVKEVIETVKKISQSDFRIIIGEKRLGDPARLVANSEKIINILKWRPRYTDLSEIIRSAYVFLIKRQERV